MQVLFGRLRSVPAVLALLLTISLLQVPSLAAQTPAGPGSQTQTEDGRVPPLPLNGAEVRDMLLDCMPRVSFDDPQSYRACFGFTSGLFIGFMALDDLLRAQLPEADRAKIALPFCLQPKTSDLRINQAILDYIRDNGREAEAQATQHVVIGAMIEHFPCRPERAE